jgi:hypothetical protein
VASAKSIKQRRAASVMSMACGALEKHGEQAAWLKSGGNQQAWQNRRNRRHGGSSMRQ